MRRQAHYIMASITSIHNICNSKQPLINSGLLNKPLKQHLPLELGHGWFPPKLPAEQQPNKPHQTK